MLRRLLVNDLKGIRRIVELVGGAWGQVPLEKTYELIEKAFFRCSQKSDELSDSYLSRCDVIWSDLLMRNIDMQQVQAYAILRGSRLSSDDKKRVIVESGAESSGKLDVKRVSQAIRMLGSGFFQEYTSGRKDKQLKTYDHTAFSIEEVMDETDTEAYWVTEDSLDEDLLETLAAQEDEDASLILQFEEAVVENLQQDPELSAYFSTYQEADEGFQRRSKPEVFGRFAKEKRASRLGRAKTKGNSHAACRVASHRLSAAIAERRDTGKMSARNAIVMVSSLAAQQLLSRHPSHMLRKYHLNFSRFPRWRMQSLYLLNVVSVDCLFGFGDTDKSPIALGHQSCHEGFHNRLRR